MLIKKLDWKTTAPMVIGAVVLIWFLFNLFTPVSANNNQPIEINIKEGQGLQQIASILKDADIIRSRGVFLFYVILIGHEKDLKAGKYLLYQSWDIPQIVSALSRGLSESNDIQVTIPEGSNIWEIDKVLNYHGLVDEGQFALSFYKNEGYLFPDTYRFPSPDDPKHYSLSEIASNFKNNFDLRTKRLNVADFYNKIIIASILEKEAKTEEDMRLVAGIIEKRLEKKLPLQIDATVIYGACLRRSLEINFRKNCDVSLVGVAQELKIDSEFNTYTRIGLPPRPISNPGLMAFEAALSSLPSNYLYYLSTRDGSQIIYSRTAAEHSFNRQKYLGL